MNIEEVTLSIMMVLQMFIMVRELKLHKWNSFLYSLLFDLML